MKGHRIVDTVTVVGIITALGTIFGLFMKYISSRDKAQERRESAQAERDAAFVQSLKDNTKAMQSVAHETKKAATEAAQRNGHLAEIAAENQAANAIAQKDILDTIAKIKTQTVEHQVVKDQTVNETHPA